MTLPTEASSSASASTSPAFSPLPLHSLSTAGSDQDPGDSLQGTQSTPPAVPLPSAFKGKGRATPPPPPAANPTSSVPTPSQCTMQTSPLPPSPSFRRAYSSKAASKTSSFFRLRSNSPSSYSKTTATSIPAPLPPTSLSNLGNAARTQTSPASMPSPAAVERRTSFEPGVRVPGADVRPGYIRKRNSYGSGVMQCGRHSNEWLFGGMSFRETFKGIVRRDSTESDR